MQFRSRKDGGHYPITAGSKTSVMDFANLTALDNIRRQRVLSQKDIQYQAMLNADEKELDVKMRKAWYSFDDRFKRLMLNHIFGKSYVGNYHGAMINAEWIEIPPAVRVEILRFMADTPRYHRFNKTWLEST